VSTTTIRIDEDLKARVAVAAERTGKTAHGFIVAAIAQATEQSELENDFHQVAARRLARILANGEGVPLREVRDYLLARVGGGTPKRPKPSKLRT
jgi:predicted transcriptional regulator